MYTISKIKSTFQLLIIMIVVSSLVAATSVLIVYAVIVNDKKDYLKELSENQTGIIRSIFEEEKNPRIILQFLERQNKFNTILGETGEFVIGYLKNDTIFFLLDHIKNYYVKPKPVPLKSDYSIPLKFAVMKNTGIIRGLDYRRRKVLAYSTYIPELNWGVVAKIDVSEVNEPFNKAGKYALLITLLLVSAGTLVFRKISDPITDKIIDDDDKLKAILDATQESIYLFDRQGKFQTVNRIGAMRLQRKPAEITGHHYSEFMTPELALSRQRQLDLVFSTGNPVQFEDIRDGQHFEHHFFPCFKNNEVNYVASYSRDITDINKKEKQLIKLNQILKALEKSSKAMLKASDEAAYIEEVCRIVVNDCGFKMVWIGFARDNEAKTVEPVAYSGFEKGYLDTLNITWDESPRGSGPTGIAIRTGKPSICRNMFTDPSFTPWREEATKRGYSSSLVLPLIDNGRAFGAINIYSTEPDSFSAQEVNFLSELASDLAYGILALRLRIAQSRAEEELRITTQRLKHHFENSPLACVEWDADFLITQWSSEAERIFGWKNKEMIGKRIDVLKLIFEEDIPVVSNAMERLASGKEITVISSNRNYTKTGSVIYCTWYNSVLFDSNGQMSSVMSLVEDITDRKQMEDQLKESEKRYRELVKNAPTGIYEIDFLTNKFISVNDAMCHLSGYTKEELLSMYPPDILEEESRERFQERINKMLNGEKPAEDIEYRVKAKDGHIIHALLNVKFKLNEQGKPVGATVVGHDITERKKAEEALRESEKRFRTLAENIPDMILRFDRNLKVLYANPAVLRRTGISAHAIVGKTSQEYGSSKSSYAMWDKAAREVLESGEMKRYEHSNSWKGDMRIFDAQIVPERDSEGNINAVIAIAHDITKRKKAEIALRDSEEKLKLALDSGSIGVWEWNMLTQELEWDERMERIFGFEPGIFEKTYDAFEACLVDEDIPHMRNAIKRALTHDLPFETIYRIKSVRENTKYISARGLVNKNAEGIPVRMTGVCYDITELKRDTDRLLFTLNEELLRSNKELEQFAYVASHDLQEPLRMISSFTQLLAQRYQDKLDQDAREFIRFAVDGATYMQTLINDLLAYSRIQTMGKEFSMVDMEEVLGMAIYNLGMKITEKNAKITYDKLPVLHVDKGQIVQLFQNLIGNAVKFSLKSPEVHITAREENNHFVFSVKDNGIGIEKTYYDRIFQIFQKLHPKDEYEGTGIGLAVCKRIVDRHGGKIWVESEPGQGSTFYFVLNKVNNNKDDKSIHETI